MEIVTLDGCRSYLPGEQLDRFIAEFPICTRSSSVR
jgi:hypothetical protein